MSLKPISEIIKFVRNGASIKQSANAKGSPITRIETIALKEVNLDKCGYADVNADGYKKYILKEGDILISHINSMKHLGKCAIFKGSKKDIIHGMNLLCLRVNEKIAFPIYFFYMLSSPLFLVQLSKITKNSVNQSSFNVKNFISLKLPLPPLKTQKHIANILEKADQLRKDCQQMEQELNQLAQSVFIEIFGDPVLNPKGWEIKEIGELGEIKGGLQVTRKRSVNPIEVPYLRVANIYRDLLKLDEIKILRVTQKELNRATLCTGDVLFVEGHGNANEIGRTSVWDGSILSCVHQNHLIRFRPHNMIIPTFVSFFINSASGRQQILKMSKTTSGLNTLSASNISKIKIYVPPISIQNKFLRIINKIKIQIDNNKEQIIQLDNNFNTLSQKAFKGELKEKR